MLIYGLNPVLEALRAGRVTWLRVGERQKARLLPLVERAMTSPVRVEVVEHAALDRAARGGAHQGVVADVSDPPTYAIGDLIAHAARPPLFVVLDGIEDPQNLGAILRTCDAAGVDGVIRQTRHAAPLDGATAKASAGAVAHLRIADVVNIARALEELKAAAVWTVGLSGDADQPYDSVDYTLPTALVMGAEGAGLRRLVRQRCDRLVSIPMRGQITSLNVSVASGVALFEVLRQRRVSLGSRRAGD